MNTRDIKPLLQHGLLRFIQLTASMEAGELVLTAQILMQLPNQKEPIPFDFHTDRPFYDRSEVYDYFRSLGVPQSRIIFELPQGSGRLFSPCELIRGAS